jgi:hypothetical protein
MVHSAGKSEPPKYQRPSEEGERRSMVLHDVLPAPGDAGRYIWQESSANGACPGTPSRLFYLGARMAGVNVGKYRAI